MARIETLNMLTSDEGALYLAEEYGKVIENVQKRCISSAMKNTELSGDPTAGTVEAKRFVNASSQDYGTARTAGKGNQIKADPVTVAINVDHEIVEEAESKDISLLGVEGWFGKRAANHQLRLTSELDTAFFAEAAAEGTAVTVTDTAIEDIVEALIQQCENTQNDFVDGVDRSMMHLVCNTSMYGKIRTYLDKVTVPNVDSTAEEFYTYHGVKAYSCVHLPSTIDAILMVDGAVAQPIMSTPYTAERVPLSNAMAVELFYHYGTKAVTPDLIFTYTAS